MLLTHHCSRHLVEILNRCLPCESRDGWPMRCGTFRTLHSPSVVPGPGRASLGEQRSPCIVPSTSVCSKLEWRLAVVEQVTCGSMLKLQHDQTKSLLHSHDIPYRSGSGQQSVTTNFETNDANSMWTVKMAKVYCSLQNCVQVNDSLNQMQRLPQPPWWLLWEYGQSFSNSDTSSSTWLERLTWYCKAGPNVSAGYSHKEGHCLEASACSHWAMAA